MTGKVMDALKIVLCLSLILLQLVGVSSQSTRCNLRNGAGCTTTSAFTYQFNGTSQGNSQCGRKYRLTVNSNNRMSGFVCFLATESPNGDVYTISHNPINHQDASSPWINFINNRARFQTKINGVEPWSRNYWIYSDFHHRVQPSFVMIVMVNGRLTYYSQNTEDQFNIEHPFFFRPTQSEVFIGLNRKYENGEGEGLCAIDCQGFPRNAQPQSFSRRVNAAARNFGYAVPRQ